jgi:hypothetical protein
MSCDRDQVIMVRQVKDLSALREFAEHSKSGGRPRIVEVDQEVIGHEWQRSAVPQVQLDRRQPQGEVKLVS